MSGKGLKYMPALDGLRAIAALMVVIQHYTYTYYDVDLHIGHVGVQVFFILSGFLITSILLNHKHNGQSNGRILKNFFVRRFLRLFPIYYLLLIGLWILGELISYPFWMEGNGIYYFTYTSNFLNFNLPPDQMFPDYSLNHTWTLAIEEQFYLIWPWVVVILSPRKMLILTPVLVIASLCFIHLSGVINSDMLLIAQLDTLGAGAFLAVLFNRGVFDKLKLNSGKMDIILIVTLGLFVLRYVLRLPALIEDLLLIIFPVCFIIMARLEIDGGFNKIFRYKYLVYLGKISYGIYLYHKVMPEFEKIALLAFKIKVPNEILYFGAVVLTVIVSHFSFNYIEQRFLSLKAKFV